MPCQGSVHVKLRLQHKTHDKSATKCILNEHKFT